MWCTWDLLPWARLKDYFPAGACPQWPPQRPRILGEHKNIVGKCCIAFVIVTTYISFIVVCQPCNRKLNQLGTLTVSGIIIISDFAGWQKIHSQHFYYFTLNIYDILIFETQLGLGFSIVAQLESSTFKLENYFKLYFISYVSLKVMEHNIHIYFFKIIVPKIYLCIIVYY